MSKTKEDVAGKAIAEAVEEFGAEAVHDAVDAAKEVYENEGDQTEVPQAEGEEKVYVIVFDVGSDRQPFQLAVEDPKAAQQISVSAVKNGVYSMQTENGIRTIPVYGSEVVVANKQKEVE